MDSDELSVISMHEITANQELEEAKDTKRMSKSKHDSSPWNIFHVFSVFVACIGFSCSFTLIPRTNSIFYQAHWLEVNIPVGFLMLLDAVRVVLTMAIYFNDDSLKSFQTLVRMYLLNMTTWIVPYLIVYLIWCSYLGYNWPIPYLGYNMLIGNITFFAGMWIVLPHNILSKKEFQRNMKLYILVFIVGMIMLCLREGISILFKILPAYLQWTVAFLIPLLKHFDMWSRSKLVNRMTGGQCDASRVLLGISINASYSNFVAVRISGAETITVCFIIAVDFVLQLQMTRKIVHSHKNVIDQEMETDKIEKTENGDKIGTS